MAADVAAVAAQLVEHTRAVQARSCEAGPAYAGDPEADALIVGDPFAFVLAVLFDEGQRAETVWRYPLVLQQALESRGRGLSPTGIAGMRLTDLVQLFWSTTPRLRFPTKFACFTLLMAEHTMEQFGGNAASIWSDTPSAADLQERLAEFYGIGQKKASMATNMLVRDLGVRISDAAGIDVSGDKHVRQVFLRSGLIDEDSVDAAVGAARDAHPVYPGELDLGAWTIGRKHCLNEGPKCGDCPLSAVCAKRTNLVAQGT